jgi:hypothetical protein
MTDADDQLLVTVCQGSVSLSGAPGSGRDPVTATANDGVTAVDCSYCFASSMQL